LRIDKLHHFTSDISHLKLPKRFNFPFYYEPHELSRIAASQLQHYLGSQQDFDHDFGLGDAADSEGIGKMFGVLVVQDKVGRLGYLAAYSGKLAGTNDHQYFVPTIFDMLITDSFYKREEAVINEINQAIDTMVTDPNYQAVASQYLELQRLAKGSIQEEKLVVREGKKARKRRRKVAEGSMSSDLYMELLEGLKEESLKEHFCLREIESYWEYRLAQIRMQVDPYDEKLLQLKQSRKAKSAALQQKLFAQYQFLNSRGERKGLDDIFVKELGIIPPAGAGECAAPKLLQYAFEHELRPLTMAEFWWGRESSQQIRKPGHYYPSCRSKCEPILGHMLVGMEVDENPMLTNPAEGKTLDNLYEDDYLLVINKPPEFLSVPGKTITDSVFERVKQLYPDATGPLIVHRLDMSTSGIMLIAKSKAVHRSLQNQFIRRKVHKRYVALLEGRLTVDSGVIDLPLRVDLDNRPFQMVCQEHGKAATTEWEVISKSASQTRVRFHPITGRTHQLRVHAAHPLGLNHPIVGDDLYGRRADRLYLHAECLSFWHPVHKEMKTVEASAPF